jgi:LysM repeat protein
MPSSVSGKSQQSSGLNKSGGFSQSVGNGKPTSTPKTTYTVKSGDTLSQISKTIGKSVPSLMANNPQIKDANKISVGQKISISGNSGKTPSGYTVKNGDTLSKVAKANNTTVGNLLRANPQLAKTPNLIYPGQKLTIPGGSDNSGKPAPVGPVAPVKPGKPSKGVNTQLPATGVGYVSYYSAARKYGTASTVEKIQNIAKEWNKRHPNLPVQIGDMSKKGGGDISGHASHEKGVDVDMRPFRKDGTQGPVTINQKNYDAKTTREFVKMVKEMYPNTLIGFKDSQTVKSGLTQPWDNHSNHLHIRFL